MSNTNNSRRPRRRREREFIKVTIKQRKDTGAWQMRYTINGKQTCKQVGYDRLVAEEIRAKTEREVNDPRYREIIERRQGYKLSQLITAFKKTFLHVRPKTKRGYSAQLNDFLNYWNCELGYNPSLEEIDRDMIDTYLDCLFDRDSLRNKGNKMSMLTVKKYYQRLQSMFDYALNKELIDKNPVFPRVFKGAYRKHPRPLINKEVSKVLKAVPGTKFELFFPISVYAGTRMSETIALDWSDIYFSRGSKSGLIKINKSVEDGKVVHNVKSNSSVRNIPLNPQLEALLLPHRRESGPVCLNTKGDRLRYNIWRDLKKLYRSVDIHNANVHSLRHTFISFALLKYSWAQVQSWAGHSSTEVTKLYAQLQKISPEDISDMSF